MVKYEFDGHFSISIVSKESQPITKEMWVRVGNTLQEALNEEKVIRKIKQRFELSTIDEVRCEIIDVLTVKPKAE